MAPVHEHSPEFAANVKDHMSDNRPDLHVDDRSKITETHIRDSKTNNKDNITQKQVKMIYGGSPTYEEENNKTLKAPQNLA